jgi:integrase
MAGKKSSFRVGRVQGYLRGQVWYLCYHEQGQRRRPRVGPDREAAKQLAAQVNAQLEVGAPAALSFEPIAIPELRERWLQHHEQVLRSSVQTINRYRTATEHLLRFVATVRPVRYASHFGNHHAEEFVRHLRTIQVAANGHKNTPKRPLMDKGIRYILETCRALFNYAGKRRHLPPYAENPFSTLEIDRIPLEQVRPITLFTPEQERAFLEACDDWQFPVFLTLMLTGLRPGELTHLLLPDDLDLEGALLRVRNKPKLGWRVKTRNERDIPLLPVLVDVLRQQVGQSMSGPVFRRRKFVRGCEPPLKGMNVGQLEGELASRIATRETGIERSLSRHAQLNEARTLWRDVGAIKTDRVRVEFMRLTSRIGLAATTAPKLLRHLFATGLQEANVDPLVRNELMGHSPGDSRGNGTGLGMTAVYTHTRPETRRKQLESALLCRPAVPVAQAWLARINSSSEERRSKSQEKDAH